MWVMEATSGVEVEVEAELVAWGRLEGERLRFSREAKIGLRVEAGRPPGWWRVRVVKPSSVCLWGAPWVVVMRPGLRLNSCKVGEDGVDFEKGLVFGVCNPVAMQGKRSNVNVLGLRQPF